MKICPADRVVTLCHNEFIGFPGTNPNIQIVEPSEADFIWYACLGDGEELRLDLMQLNVLSKPLISVVLGDHDYRDCLSPENRKRHFSCAIDDWPRCVPCIYKAERHESKPKDIFASFVGSFSTHPRRPELMRLSCDDVIVEHREWWNTGQGEQSANRARYNDVIDRSKFVLCPRGYGPTSMRMADAILRGAIPLTVDDHTNWFGEFNSFNFAIRGSFDNLEDILEAARNMSAEEYDCRLRSMNEFRDEYLLGDLHFGCRGTLGYTEWIRRMV